VYVSMYVRMRACVCGGGGEGVGGWMCWWA